MSKRRKRFIIPKSRGIRAQQMAAGMYNPGSTSRSVRALRGGLGSKKRWF